MLENLIPILEWLLKLFGWYTILYVLFAQRIIDWKNYNLHKVDDVLCVIAALVGILLLSSFILDFKSTVQVDEGEGMNMDFFLRLLGPLIYSFMTYYFLYFISSQLLWIKQVRRMKLFRVFASLLFIIPFERMYIFTVTTYRDLFTSLG